MKNEYMNSVIYKQLFCSSYLISWLLLRLLFHLWFNRFNLQRGKWGICIRNPFLCICVSHQGIDVRDVRWEAARLRLGKVWSNHLQSKSICPLYVQNGRTVASLLCVNWSLWGCVWSTTDLDYWEGGAGPGTMGVRSSVCVIPASSNN